jgi:hypothetical protein
MNSCIPSCIKPVCVCGGGGGGGGGGGESERDYVCEWERETAFVVSPTFSGHIRTVGRALSGEERACV